MMMTQFFRSLSSLALNFRAQVATHKRDYADSVEQKAIFRVSGSLSLQKALTKDEYSLRRLICFTRTS